MAKKILIIDDNLRILKSIRNVTEKEGFIVETESNATNAIDTIKKFKPDLIVLDVVMPNQTGLHISRQIRKIDEGKNVKIIIYSGELTDLVDHFKSFGADLCLLKSTEHQQLIQSIKDLT